MKNLSEDGKTVTIYKFENFDPPETERSDSDELAIIIDVETTGLSPQQDRVIQLAIRPFYFNIETFEVTAIVKQMVFLQDPQQPIREEITALTGLRDSDVAGQEINWEWVRSALHRVKHVISHNAAFDRSFIESELAHNNQNFTDGPIWSCSMRQIAWHDVCRPSHALEVLCAWSGFFYDSHRAENDVNALLHLLRVQDKLKELITRSSLSEHRVFAANSPRELNPLLKRRWYRWDPNVFMWWKGFESAEEAASESEWLLEHLPGVEPQIFEVEPKYRYSPE